MMQYPLVQFSAVEDMVVVLREPGNRVERLDPDRSTMAEGDMVAGRIIHLYSWDVDAGVEVGVAARGGGGGAVLGENEHN
jgi:hypothetical protein